MIKYYTIESYLKEKEDLGIHRFQSVHLLYMDILKFMKSLNEFAIIEYCKEVNKFFQILENEESIRFEFGIDEKIGELGLNLKIIELFFKNVLKTEMSFEFGLTTDNLIVFGNKKCFRKKLCQFSEIKDNYSDVEIDGTNTSIENPFLNHVFVEKQISERFIYFEEAIAENYLDFNTNYQISSMYLAYLLNNNFDLLIESIQSNKDKLNILSENGITKSVLSLLKRINNFQELHCNS